VDEEMETELAQAAAEFDAAPKRLQAAILKAAAKGNNANKITKAIRQVYSPDYVRRLIRDARKAGQIPPS
jgi:diadenosine tetraphosphate (Ap4A) HIT family hydrolase